MAVSSINVDLVFLSNMSYHSIDLPLSGSEFCHSRMQRIKMTDLGDLGVKGKIQNTI